MSIRCENALSPDARRQLANYLNIVQHHHPDTDTEVTITRNGWHLKTAGRELRLRPEPDSVVERSGNPVYR